ncbi:putative pentatricopeptide repeat-containing protein At1g74400 isoform X2 [Tripterygium wilfordii]|nr:putative pentatricopeptide repeat-containing protein At1g74400 isoform X2 [Tripterygium wilfordii]XP_038680486.1 putative pentatricopeptide repeat-containing protein At1g74400 isoform X2 [Tripterygium wilfordii]
MRLRNMVCWTALISAYVDNQRPGKALQLFRQMQMDNVEPDKVTLTVTLSACADLGALGMGEWIHAFIRRKQGFSSDLSLNNALINMYAKCGDMKNGRRLFDSIQKKDVTTWTSLIVGHALHGEAKEALELFEEMKAMNTDPREMNSGRSSFSILPNHVTFLGVLMACSHAGIIEEGKHHFISMNKDYGLNPRDSHFGCMVDLFCRAGQLKEAYDFISAMPVQPNAVVWRTLLGACSLQGNIQLGQEVRRKLLELEPNYVGDYVAMSNIFAAKSMWDEKMVAREQIKQRRAPGCSSIEVGSGISEFVASAFDHPLSNNIYEVLRNLTVTMRAHGYSPELSSLKEY